MTLTGPFLRRWSAEISGGKGWSISDSGGLAFGMPHVEVDVCGQCPWELKNIIHFFPMRMSCSVIIRPLERR